MVTVYSGNGFGVEKTQIMSGAGATEPSLSSATSTDLNLVRVVFDTDMLNSLASKESNYSIIKTADLDPLIVIRVIPVNSTTFDLLTEDQENTTYQLTVSNVRDSYGTKIGSNNTANFLGTPPEDVFTLQVHSFFGLESGVQEESQALDSTPPELRNAVPAQNSTEVTRFLSQISFDILDIDGQVDPTTIDAYVNGSKVYDGATDTFFSPWNGGSSSVTNTTVDGYDAYAVILDYNGPTFNSYQQLAVQVLADDLFANTMNVNYNISIEDIEEIIFTNISPAPGSFGVDENTNISITFYDEGSGVDFNTIEAYVAGVLAYQGNTNTFNPPYDGVGSSITPTTVDGYDGYVLVIDPSGAFPSNATIPVVINVFDKEDN